ncbi:hypothetical protein [Botrimarina mediterranea]|uniref:Uncharacterized protein n=1 Tax=Botrimarina mediterranea TaxID=2528022 RepID=A0A518K304_9BACT|nr:hypothetical protein [Botrimarina mediterranea]QDV72181.1 hypothetical protein Spa11_03530 [Botrimarina mediterranea]QDV76724.1 hypothetical protein K2D_03050 [Planctomycetes bacterium K2D]
MKRFVNAAVALAATLVAYQLYVLAVVPIVEPGVALRAFDPASDPEWDVGGGAVKRYQKLLASYLPTEHWALRGTPQVYEYGPLVLVLEDFKPISGGRIEISRSVLVAFPTPYVHNQPPPRDAIIAEAPNPSRIQFDSPDGLSFTSTQIGRPVAGEFTGEVLIHSDMQEAGPADDLRIVTRDVRFNQAMITTNAAVDLRIGPHRARGKVLEVRLLTEPHAGASGSSMPITGVDTLEIREQVQALISTGKLDTNVGMPRGAAQDEAASSGPLELTSQGPFRFDFTRFIASLQDDVRATLRNPGAEPDQLYCRELRLHFGDADGGAAEIDPADEPEIARRQGKLLSGMTPRLVEAVGAPVRFDSPSRQASVRGRRLRGWIADRRLRIEGSPALLAHGLSEASAPVLEYTSPPADSPQVVGDLLAAGPGWLKLTPSPDEPERNFQARWNEVPKGEPAVVLRRDNRGQPMLTMLGRPEFAAAGLGKIRADRVVANLSEVAADGPDGPAIELTAGNGQQGAVLVNRVDAIGAVEFVGQDVEGYADDLVALMRPLPPSETPRDNGDVVTGPSFGPAPAAATPQQQLATSDGQRYRLRTKSIQIDVGLAGRRATPVAMICNGGVRIEEEPRADGQQPLQIAGQQLRVDRLDRPGGARLTLTGAGDAPPAAGAEHHGLAEIKSQGLNVWVHDLHVDQAAGQAWTEGHGDARLLLPSQNGATPFAGEATLRWRGGMRFDGAKLVLSDEVFAESAGGWLSCTEMTATLAQPIDLRTGAHAGGGAVEVAQVECGGGVTIDYRGADEAGQTSHERAQTKTLAINRLTGAVTGRGPGTIRSVRLAGAGGGPFSGPAVGDKDKGGLRFLRVDFNNGIAGNYLERRAQFAGNVQVVYGPVLAWDHQLPLHSPEGVPPDSVELRCEELRVLEDPAFSVRRGGDTGAPFGPIELVAMRGVRIDAAMGADGGGAIAEAVRASYSQAADRAILEGDGTQLAKLWLQQNGQQQPVPMSGQRLTHYITLGRTTFEDIRGAEYQPPVSATRPAPPPR